MGYNKYAQNMANEIGNMSQSKAKYNMRAKNWTIFLL